MLLALNSASVTAPTMFSTVAAFLRMEPFASFVNEKWFLLWTLT